MLEKNYIIICSPDCCGKTGTNENGSESGAGHMPKELPPSCVFELTRLLFCHVNEWENWLLTLNIVYTVTNPICLAKINCKPPVQQHQRQM